MRALIFVVTLYATALQAGVNVWSNSGPEEAQIIAMAVSPKNPAVIVAAGKFAIFRSTNAGESWTRVVPGGELFGGSLVRFDPASNDVWVAYHGGLLQSDDDGATWLAAPVLERRVSRLAIDAPRRIFYAATTEGLFVRKGAEGSWEKRDPAGAGEGVGDVDVDLASGTVWAATDQGLFESHDAGGSWKPIAFAGKQVERVVFEGPSTLHILNDTTYRRSSDGGRTWSAPDAVEMKLYDIAFAGRGTLYATGDTGVVKSADDGRTWKPLAAPPGAPLRLPAVDPQNPSRLYAPAYDEAIYKSVDGGRGWTRKSKGLLGASVSDVVLDPKQAGTIYVFGTHLYKSTDGGATWTTLLRQSLAEPIGHLSVAADSTITVYNLLRNVPKRSTDGGKSWSDGKAEPDFALFFDDAKSGARYRSGVRGLAVSRDGGKSWKRLEKHVFRRMVFGDGRAYGIEEFELLASSDGGTTWKNVEIDVGFNVYDVALDPKNASNVFVALQNGVAVNQTAGSGKWTLLNRGLPRREPIRSIAIHPVSPNTMLAGTESQGLYATNTTGREWVRFHPENGPQYVSRVVIDPLDPTRIYVATEGESVFAMQIPH